jgi:hypothetical protein
MDSVVECLPNKSKVLSSNLLLPPPQKKSPVVPAGHVDMHRYAGNTWLIQITSVMQIYLANLANNRKTSTQIF